MKTKSQPSNSLFIIAKIIFYFCSFYFLAMGLALIFIPELLVKGVAGVDVNSTIIGMLRGAGGSIVPYALLYVLAARNPTNNAWSLYVIGTANVIAIILDLSSVALGEYRFSYALYDVPVEMLSLVAIIIFKQTSQIPYQGK